MASDAAMRDYQRKLVSADRAVSEIRSGQRVFVGSGAAEPQCLVQALATRGSNGSISDAEIVHILTLGIAPYAEPHFSDQFRHNAFFIGPNVRDAVNDCRADYTPIFLSEVPALFRRGQVPLDFALVQVSPPDRYGYCSLGASVDVVKAAAESAKHIIAEVNSKAPVPSVTPSYTSARFPRSWKATGRCWRCPSPNRMTWPPGSAGLSPI